MRADVEDPFADALALRRAVRAAEDLYARHERGEACGAPLREFASLVGRGVDAAALDAAFGSVAAETFAKRMLLDDAAIPPDLTDADLAELVGRVRAVRGDEFQLEYWMLCLERATGNDAVGDLIFWPDSYFAGRPRPETTSDAEIVAAARADGRAAIVLPVPLAPGLSRD